MKATVKVPMIFIVLAVVVLSIFAQAWAETDWSRPERSGLANVRTPRIAQVQSVRWQAPAIPALPALPALPEHPARAFPRQGPDGDKLVMGGSYTLKEGETLSGNLVVMGGSAALEEDSTVEGDVAVMGGSVNSKGRIEGNVVIFGGSINLADGAVVEGDISTFGGSLTRAEGAVVEGKVFDGMVGPLPLVIPGQIQGLDNLEVGLDDWSLNPIWQFMGNLLWAFVRSFIWAFLAVLLVLFLPDHTERVTQAAVAQPLIAGGLGLLTGVVAPLALALIGITIIGIPVSLVGALLLFLAWGFGVIAVGMEVGKRLAHAFKQEWALAVSAGLGTFLLTLVVNSINAVIPCFGWIAPALVGMIGLGAVLLTVFGTRNYPPDAPVAPLSVPELPEA